MGTAIDLTYLGGIERGRRIPSVSALGRSAAAPGSITVPFSVTRSVRANSECRAALLDKPTPKDTEAVVGFFNERRGLHIPGSDFQYYSEGAYAVVFASRSGRPTARKLFRVKAESGREHSARTFAAEVAAFELAMASDHVRTIVPEFFGQQPAERVSDRDGTDVSAEFYPDLAFDMEFIEQPFRKLVYFSAFERKRVSSILNRAGIFYTIDASACGTDDCISKVIDFSTHEIEPWGS